MNEFIDYLLSQNQNYDLYEGRHDAIITQAQWDAVKAAQERRGHPSTHTAKELQNTFVGILFCEKCGARLKRNVPGKNQGTTPWFRCPTRHCDCRSIKCHILEDTVRSAMDDWLDEYIIQLDAEEKTEKAPVIEELEIIQDQLTGLLHQQDTICGYLEKGIYTIEMFQKRNASLSKEIAFARLDKGDFNRENLEFKAQAISYITTSRAGFEPEPITALSEKFSSLESKEKRAVLSQVRDHANAIVNSMNKVIEPKNKEHGDR